MKFSVCVPGKAENHTIVKMKKPAGLCYNSDVVNIGLQLFRKGFA